MCFEVQPGAFSIAWKGHRQVCGDLCAEWEFPLRRLPLLVQLHTFDPATFNLCVGGYSKRWSSMRRSFQLSINLSHVISAMGVPHDRNRE